MKSLVMKHAWVMAKAWAAAYGVKASEMMSACLKVAWACAKPVAPPTGLALRGNGEKVTVYLGGAWLCTVWGNDKASVVAGIVELGKLAVGTELYRLRIAYRMLVPQNKLLHLSKE